jgi:hypothetical protein
LFHQAHRAVLGLLQSKKLADSEEEAAWDRFLCARGALTLVYRNIILKDLLARIMHPSVYKFYVSQRAPDFEFLDRDAVLPDRDSPIPLEFSHAAFRFGHSMVRPSYRFSHRPRTDFRLSDVLSLTSKGEVKLLPLEEKWILRWSYFFEIDGSRPNLSRRIGPAFSPALIDNGLFRPIDEIRTQGGLAYRDLLVGQFLNLWPVPELIATIKRLRPALFEEATFLSHPDKDGRDYQAHLRDHLQAVKADEGLNDGDVKVLVDNPPLAFFVLWEAAFDPDAKGLRLGLLGSIIIAEVILATIERDPITPSDGDGLKASLAAFARQTYGADGAACLSAMNEIDSMETLIKFVAEQNGLRQVEPAFI